MFLHSMKRHVHTLLQRRWTYCFHLSKQALSWRWRVCVRALGFTAPAERAHLNSFSSAVQHYILFIWHVYMKVDLLNPAVHRGGIDAKTQAVVKIQCYL